MPPSTLSLAAQRGRALLCFVLACAGCDAPAADSPRTAASSTATAAVRDTARCSTRADAEGPAANAVKDAQRAKTTEESQQTLTLIWGTTDLPGRADAVLRWMMEQSQTLVAKVQRL